jgi:hypothetical protein
MRMRQSASQIERAFAEETRLDRERRERLRRTAVQRERVRTHQRAQQAGSFRFFLLVISMIGTAVLVTAVMFKTLSIILG